MMSGGLGPEPVAAEPEVEDPVSADEDEELDSEDEARLKLTALMDSASSGSEGEDVQGDGEAESEDVDGEGDEVESTAAATVKQSAKTNGAPITFADLVQQNGAEDEAGEGEDDDAEEEQDDIPLSDIESIASDDRGDIVPHQRLTINNTTALLAAHKRIALDLSALPFSSHHSVTSDAPTEIADIDDDLTRELAFYKQSLDAVTFARKALKKEGMAFSRPTDYFAEMVKSEEHMGRVRQKLVDAAAGRKASADAKKQRDLKKFGKQIQIAKLQERDKSKRETMEKVNSLKRSTSAQPILIPRFPPKLTTSPTERAGNAIDNEKEPDMFDIALDEADDKNTRRRRDGAPSDAKKPKINHKRTTKNEKYGFGGKKRHAKSGDAFSSADMSGFMKGRNKRPGGRPGAKSAAASRPGKARRAKGRL